MSDPNGSLAAVHDALSSDHLQSECQQIIGDLMHRHGELRLAVISTLDARIFAQASRHDIDGARLAALSSTLMSVADTLGRELDGGPVAYNSLKLDRLVMVSHHIPDRSGAFTLSIVATADLVMALALRHCFDTSARLARALDGSLESNHAA